MATHNIVVFGGDHCGPEVVAEAVKVSFCKRQTMAEQYAS